MPTMNFTEEATPSELYHWAYMSGQGGNQLDTSGLQDREDVDLDWLWSEYELGRKVSLDEAGYYDPAKR